MTYFTLLQNRGTFIALPVATIQLTIFAPIIDQQEDTNTGGIVFFPPPKFESFITLGRKPLTLQPEAPTVFLSEGIFVAAQRYATKLDTFAPGINLGYDDGSSNFEEELLVLVSAL